MGWHLAFVVQVHLLFVFIACMGLVAFLVCSQNNVKRNEFWYTFVYQANEYGNIESGISIWFFVNIFR